MSLLEKIWMIKNTDPELSIQEKIFLNRGLKTTSEREKFLNTEKLEFHDPFLMKNMDRAVERIQKAIKKQEKIIIFGDYDVDGISGTAILVHTLTHAGANVSYRLPHRIDDGYSLSEKFIEEFKNIGVTLVITVDCGISCQNQIALAKKYGIDVIITDHHTIPELFPDAAYAVLHPLQPDCPYPFKGLTGTGVAFKLAQAIGSADLNNLLILAALGTIADLGPLIDENRLIVKKGLKNLAATTWFGLNLLRKNAGLENEPISAYHIGYRIAPRINAAGRIAHPYISLQLLLHEKPHQNAVLLAQELEQLNQKRKQMVEKAIGEAIRSADHSIDKILILSSPDWHTGILGLIAGKLSEEFNRPAIVLQDFGAHLIASARSPAHFNIVEVLACHKNLLVSFGGHAQAAGFTVLKENFEQLKKQLQETAKNFNDSIKPELIIDAEVNEKDINKELVEFIERLEPCGIGNETPRFLLRKAKITNLRTIGADQSHVQFQTLINKKPVNSIAFRFGKFAPQLQKTAQADLVIQLQKNIQFARDLEFKVIDMNI